MISLCCYKIFLLFHPYPRPIWKLSLQPRQCGINPNTKLQHHKECKYQYLNYYPYHIISYMICRCPSKCCEDDHSCYTRNTCYQWKKAKHHIRKYQQSTQSKGCPKTSIWKQLLMPFPSPPSLL